MHQGYREPTISIALNLRFRVVSVYVFEWRGSAARPWTAASAAAVGAAAEVAFLAKSAALISRDEMTRRRVWIACPNHLTRDGEVTNRADREGDCSLPDHLQVVCNGGAELLLVRGGFTATNAGAVELLAPT